MSRAMLIMDACVLIDFWDADPSVLTLAVRHIGEIHVAENVLAEVQQIDRAEAVSAGLKIVEPTLDMMTAAAHRRQGLSFEDHLCMLLAKEHVWTCVSNDGRLRNVCEDEGISVMWGLQLLAELVEAGGLPVDESIDLARQMASCNHYLTPAVLERFVRRVSKLR